MRGALADRDDYPTLAECVYLNQASLGLIGRPAVDAMHAHLDDVARHGNLHLSDEDEVGVLDGLRQRSAELLGVAAGRVAIVASASELLGQTPFLLAPRPGSTVLAVATDFPAVTRPWLRLAEEGGVTVSFVEDRASSDLTDDLIARIDERTSTVAVGWVQYGTGTVVDVPRLRSATDEVGARLVVDATQGAGALPVDAEAWRADVVVSSGYKWLGGHGGVALGVLAPDLVQRTPILPGWMGTASPFAFDATHLPWAPDARRFTQSTMSYVSVVGLTAALEQLLAVGATAIEQHATRLAGRLVDAAGRSGWEPYRAPADVAASPHVVSLAPADGAPRDDLQGRLRDRGLVCSSRGGRLRVSLALYNDDGDVDALTEALADL